jgi:hypothetical protein
MEPSTVAFSLHNSQWYCWFCQLFAPIGLLHSIEVSIDVVPHADDFGFPKLVNDPIVWNSIHNPQSVQFRPTGAFSEREWSPG